MPDVVIENPILNSPFAEPARHFAFGSDGITSDIVEARRASAYLVPIPQPRRRSGAQLALEADAGMLGEQRENTFINDVRARVGAWRASNWSGATPTSRRLLAHWAAQDRARPFFFCQLEAVETAIFLAEIAPKSGSAHLVRQLEEHASLANPGLLRIAFKMATGSGKTMVMSMIVAWQTLNRLAAPRDPRYASSFLVVAPGITIRDRLRVLLPHDPENLYAHADVVPLADRDRIGRARVVITNFHAFMLRERQVASKTTKALLTRGGPSPFVETPDQMVARVCKGLAKGVVVLNDEAHHCYRPKPADPDEGRLTGDDLADAKKRDAEARVWVSGVEAVTDKLGVRAVYDVSATPFYLQGSGYREGDLFPWVASDFSLIDAIESGIAS